MVLLARQWGRPTPLHMFADAFLCTALLAVNAAMKYLPIANVFAIYPVFAAFCFASYMLITRKMTQRGSRLALQFWIGVFAALALAAATAIGDRLGAPALRLSMPDAYEVGLLAAMGLAAAISHQMIAHALVRAEAGALAPLQYLEIISATLIGWLVFGDFPDRLTSGNVTDDIILQYIEQHADNPTGVSR